MSIFSRNTKTNKQVIEEKRNGMTADEMIEAKRLVRNRSSINHATAGKDIRGLEQMALVAEQTEREVGWMYQD